MPISVGRLLASDINTRTTAYSLTIDTSTLDSLPDRITNAITIAIGKGVLDLQELVQKNIETQNLIDTGNLLNSVAGVMVNAYQGYVLVGAFYGIYLEFGTVKMAARPFFGPAVDEYAPKWIEIVIENLTEMLNGS